MNIKRILRRLLSAMVIVATLSTSSRAAEKSAAELLPATTALYVEFPAPKHVLDVVLDHPLRARLEALEDVQKGLSSPQFKALQGAVSLFESRLGLEWRPALETLTEGGIYAGVDLPTQGLAILVKSGDAATLKKALAAIIELARLDASNKGKPDPVKIGEYQGIKTYQADETIFAILGDWLLITNKADLGRQVVDAHLASASKMLAGDEQFKQARSTIAGNPAGWAYANMTALRDAGLAKKLYEEKSDNPLGELLLGGIIGSLGKTPYATVSWRLEREAVGLTLAAPHDPGSVAEPRQFYFGPEGKGVASELFRPKNTLLTLSTYRDLAGLWRAAPELFNDDINSKFTQADSQLTLFFSGREFGQDILGGLLPQIQIVVSRQTFTGERQPAVKLPAMAMVFRLKEPEKMQRVLKVSFQSIVGFANVAGSQNGQPPLDLDTEKRGDGMIIAASYPLDAEQPDAKNDRINYNFSPTMAIQGDWLILSSGQALAGELLELATSGQQQASDGQQPENTAAELDFQVLTQLAKDNRQHLVAQNMLENGHDKAQAEKQIDLLEEALTWLDDFSLSLRAVDGQLRLDMNLKLNAEKLASEK